MDALNRCDEIEVQLLNFESWIDLPIVNLTDSTTNFDEVSDDAQRLVDIVQQIQSALLSAVSDESLKDALPERRLMENYRYESSQRLQQQQQQQHPPRPQMMPKPQYPSQPEMTDLGSIPTSLFTDDQSGIPINDGPIPLGALNPTIPPPQQSYTPPTQHSRRMYNDVTNAFNTVQHQSFNMTRTGSDPNLIYHQQFMQQQQQQMQQPIQADVMHMQGLPPTHPANQNPNNPGSYGYQ